MSRGSSSTKYINSTINRADKKMKSMRKKIISIMESQEVNILILDRKYLSELIDVSLCDFFNDNLPKLKIFFKTYLNYTGFYIYYEGSSIKFIYNKAINLRW